MELNYDREKLANVCRDSNINYLGLFGSYARGEADAKSDVDLLVEFSITPSLLRHVGIEQELSDQVFGSKKVDLITRRSLKKDFAPRISRDLVILYGENINRHRSL